MHEASSPETAKLLFAGLKGLATIAELAMLLAIVYAAVMAVRYWPSIGV